MWFCSFLLTPCSPGEIYLQEQLAKCSWSTNLCDGLDTVWKGKRQRRASQGCFFTTHFLHTSQVHFLVSEGATVLVEGDSFSCFMCKVFSIAPDFSTPGPHNTMSKLLARYTPRYTSQPSFNFAQIGNQPNTKAEGVARAGAGFSLTP